MLALSDPKWQDLQGNYGNGDQIAELISKAQANQPLDEWYKDLFQGLCHQDTVSEAAYPVAPHLVKIAESAGAPRTELLILLCTCYANSGAPIHTDGEEAWHLPAHKTIHLPPQFEEEWQASAKKAIPLLVELLAVPQPELELRCLIASLDAFRGYQWLARRLENLDVNMKGLQ